LLVGDVPALLSNTPAVAVQSLVFQTKGLGQPRDVTLIPFYQLQHQRYSVYWNLMSPADWQQFANSNAVAEARIIDQVSIGDPTSESAHQLQANNSNTGNFNGLNWRDANENKSATGSFSYTMAVQPNVSMSIDCTYWGSDSGGRIFDILVNGTVIATQTLTNNLPGQFFIVEYPIPGNLTTGKTNIVITFQAHSGQMAGGLFGLQTVTTAAPGAFLGIDMSVLPSQILGAAPQSPVLVDNFQNLTNHSIASSPWLVLSSSDTNVVTVGPQNQLIALQPGTVTITASYLGFSVSRTITVAPASLRISLNGNNALISWPSNTATLQSAFSLGSTGAWSPVPTPILFANGTNQLTIAVSNRARYFRLAY
jgi:hypothetical protein